MLNLVYATYFRVKQDNQLEKDKELDFICLDGENVLRGGAGKKKKKSVTGDVISQPCYILMTNFFVHVLMNCAEQDQDHALRKKVNLVKSSN